MQGETRGVEELSRRSVLGWRKRQTRGLTPFPSHTVAFEIPSNLVLKKFRPSRWIPIISAFVLYWRCEGCC